jgi:hypothetical protein
MTYRDHLSALRSRHDALEQEVGRKAEELAEARRLLEEARAHARRPVLENIHVASPCRADWNAMTGSDRVRACGACNKKVYNLSEMTRDEAETLIIEQEGKLCVRYFQRQDGTILLKDCTLGAQARRRRRLAAIAGGAALLAAGLAVVLKVSRAQEPYQAVAGGAVALPPAPPPVTPEIEGPPADLPVHEVKGQMRVVPPTRP